MIDKSISFGQQNFLFVEVNEADITYDYVGYMTAKGTILLARFLKDGSKAKYFLGTGDFDVVFAARVTKNYTYPDELIAQRV
jgi:hypothetical protein